MTLSVSTLMMLPAVHTTHLSSHEALGIGKRPCHLVHRISLSLFELLLPSLMPLLARFLRVASCIRVRAHCKALGGQPHLQNALDNL